MLPAGMWVGPEGGVQPRPGGGDAEAVGADQPAAVRAHQREQRVLARGALGTDLGEAGGDHAQRPHAAAQRRLRRLDHALGGDGDDREVDRPRHVGDRRVGAHARDGLGVRVDGMGGAGEVAGHDVAEQLAADRAAPRRGADHGHARGREERRQRGGDGQVVAAVDALEIAGGRLDRQRHLGRRRSRTRARPRSPRSRRRRAWRGCRAAPRRGSSRRPPCRPPARAARAAACRRPCPAARRPPRRRPRRGPGRAAACSCRARRSARPPSSAIVPASEPRSSQSGSSIGSTSRGDGFAKPWKRR